MSRMKTFGKYLILFILFFIFTNVMSYELAKSNLIPIASYSVEFQNPDIIIEEANASKVNGYIKGKIKVSDKEIEKKYIRIDLISKNGNIILSKYIDVSDLKVNQQKEFYIDFKAENIKEFRMYLDDEKI